MILRSVCHFDGGESPQAALHCEIQSLPSYLWGLLRQFAIGRVFVPKNGKLYVYFIVNCLSSIKTQQQIA
jgi:hypothetical protein